jgi:Spy/CpxP family protein refolding chaperone
MKRRYFLAFPTIAAFVTSRVFGQVGDVTAPKREVDPHVSRKVLVKQSGSKAAYWIPKNATKQTKYLSTLTAVLSLTATQQQQAAAIFTDAATTHASIRSNLKAARKALSEAVDNNDTGGISQASTTLGTVTSQYVSNGAVANAAFFQILTADQQTKLSQYQGKNKSSATSASNTWLGAVRDAKVAIGA